MGYNWGRGVIARNLMGVRKRVAALMRRVACAVKNQFHEIIDSLAMRAPRAASRITHDAQRVT